MPEIRLPEKQNIDIYDFGFDNLLNRSIPQIESPLVYNQIEDRLSKLIQSGEKITGLIPGLLEAEI
mgnify:FL=1